MELKKTVAEAKALVKAKSEIQLINMDIDAFKRSNRKRQPMDKLRFSLMDELEKGKGNTTDDGGTEDDKEISMSLQPWVHAELERQLENTEYDKQHAVVICVREALYRFMAREHYRYWDRLKTNFNAKTQSFENESEDYIDFIKLCSGFSIIVPTKTKLERIPKRTFRFRPQLYEQLGAVSASIGMSLPQLVQVLLIDGLRGQPGAVCKDTMEATITDFYFQFDRRLRELIGKIRCVWDVELNENVTSTLADIDAWGGL
jgi:hypothetical protein